MGQDTLSIIALTALVLVGSYVLLVRAKKTGSDVQEPPSAATSIPYVGHIIGLVREKFEYYVRLSQNIQSPIFTISILPGKRIYVVTSLDLIQSIQKDLTAYAFPPIEAEFASKIGGASNDAHQNLMNNCNGEDGEWGLSIESYAAMRAALAPGSDELDQMNREMIANVAASLDSLDPKPSDLKTIGLYEWLTEHITLATTNAVYGPNNPFKAKHIADTFWDFEHDLGGIMISPFPSFTARKGIAARSRLVSSFEAYFSNGEHEKASALVRYRYDACVKNRLSILDTAKYETIMGVALLVNTVPAVFWTLLSIFTSADLLTSIRQEIDQVSKPPPDSPLGTSRNIDVASLKSQCPLLTSTYQECLRYRTVGASIRKVMHDTILDGRYLLKKDALIQMPSRVIHTDPAIWGDDVRSCTPDRFARSAAGHKRPKAAAFRAFGGGKTLCPGRHFATNEVLAVVAMFVMRFELSPVAGEWKEPTMWKTNAAAFVMTPDVDVEVEVRKCQRFGDAKWAFSLGSSERILAVSVEDDKEGAR